MSPSIVDLWLQRDVRHVRPTLHNIGCYLAWRTALCREFLGGLGMNNSNIACSSAYCNCDSLQPATFKLTK